MLWYPEYQYEHKCTANCTILQVWDVGQPWAGMPFQIVALFLQCHTGAVQCSTVQSSAGRPQCGLPVCTTTATSTAANFGFFPESAPEICITRWCGPATLKQTSCKTPPYPNIALARYPTCHPDLGWGAASLTLDTAFLSVFHIFQVQNGILLFSLVLQVNFWELKTVQKVAHKKSGWGVNQCPFNCWGCVSFFIFKNKKKCSEIVLVQYPGSWWSCRWPWRPVRPYTGPWTVRGPRPRY